MVKILCTLLVITSTALAQRAVPINHTDFPVLLMLGNGTVGSGFFVAYGTNLFLVTAKHVLSHVETVGNNPTNVLNASEVTCTYIRHGTTNDSEGKLILNLSNLDRDKQIKLHATRDVAAIRLGYFPDPSDTKVVRYPKPYVSYFLDSVEGIAQAESKALKTFEEIFIGNEVYLYGYPTAVTMPLKGMLDPTRPLLRRGVIADKNHKSKLIILDCPSYHGNSGGPVIESENLPHGTSYRVVGIMVQWVPAIEIWQNMPHQYQNQTFLNSGYSIVEPMDFAIELFK
jgi:hypothetical protein